MAKNNKAMQAAKTNKMMSGILVSKTSKTKFRCTKITFANSRAKRFYATAMTPNGRISSSSFVFTSSN